MPMEANMSVEDISKAQGKANVKYELAKQIRQLLDEARRIYGSQEWDDDDLENEILELISQE